jgi:hypothetical protein
MATTHQLLIADDNGNILSYDDVMEQIVQEHIISIDKQLKNIPRRSQLNKVLNRIQKVSKKFGVQIYTDLFQLN